MLAILLSHFVEAEDPRTLGRVLTHLHEQGLSWAEAADVYREAVDAGLLDFTMSGGLIITNRGRAALSDAVDSGVRLGSGG